MLPLFIIQCEFFADTHNRLILKSAFLARKCMQMNRPGSFTREIKHCVFTSRFEVFYIVQENTLK